MDRNLERQEGERRKRDILDALAERREPYVKHGRRVLLETIFAKGTATADDVYRSMTLPKDIDPRCLGAVPTALARAKIIRRVDFVPSNRPKRNASTISVWKLKRPAAARAWLAANPDRLDDMGPNAAGSPVINPIQPDKGTSLTEVSTHGT